MILDPIYDKKTLKKLIKSSCELTVSNFESYEKLVQISKQLNEKIYIHIALNTGMNRFGFKSSSEILKMLSLHKKTQNIVIKGVFSHYFLANNQKIDIFQQNKFNYFFNILSKNLSQKPIVSMCASEGTRFAPFGDMVRIGYGLYDDLTFDTVTLKSKILEFQVLNRGETAGYDGIFVAKKLTKLAVVGIGYGDGLMRSITKKGYVLVSGKPAKIVAICMDCLLIDVSKITCNIDDDVIIIGKSGENKISICDIAGWCDTIGYEIIVRLSDRIKRKFVGELKCKS